MSTTVPFTEYFDFAPKSKRKAGDGLEVGAYPFFVSSQNKIKRTNDPDYNGEALVFGTGGNASVHYVSGKFSTSGDCIIAFVKKNKHAAKAINYYLRGNMRLLEAGFKGAGLKHISKKYISDLQLPSLKGLDVEHILKILDKADGVREQRQKSLDALDDLLCATFLNMFGDPVNNPNNLKSKPLAKVCSFISGGTPSKSNAGFWGEGYLWVSPKDMKYDFIEKSIDHVTSKSLEQSNLKLIPAGATLIVVRGMILVHTVPIGMAVTDLTINQDIKAIVFKKDELNPMFAFWCLKVQQSAILSKVSTAAHGTKRLEMQDVESIPVLLPSITAQNKFCEFVEKFRSIYQEHISSNALSDELFKTLTQSAFKGEL